MKIFFSASLAGPWMSGWQRLEVLRELGHEVISFDQSEFLSKATVCGVERVLSRRFYRETVQNQFNQAISNALMNAAPEVAWLEWPMLLSHEALTDVKSRLPSCLFASFQDDNPFGTRPHESCRWQHFLRCIPAYDLHFVKRSSDVAEFKKRGAREIRLFMHGYFKPLFRHFPLESIPMQMRQPVGFVGSPLDHRVGMISELLGRHRIPLRVYGNRWNRTWAYYRYKTCFRPQVIAEDYVRVICGSRICLGFVSSSNRDQYSMRTFEVPACKGFLLAERTQVHQELFEEHKEAEFFGSTEECADKVHFYLKRERIRTQVAERGYQRCMQSGYSLHDRMARAMNEIQSLHLS